MAAGRVLSAFALIMLGLVWLLERMSVLHVDPNAAIHLLWPLLLVYVGLEGILRGNMRVLGSITLLLGIGLFLVNLGLRINVEGYVAERLVLRLPFLTLYVGAFLVRYWPVFLVVSGIVALLQAGKRWVGAILFFVGFFLQMHVLGMVDELPWDILWSLSLASIGLNLLFPDA